MSNESYSLVLNSQNATNRLNTSTTSMSYNINWDALLPRKYSQYSLNWQLKSNVVQTVQFTGTITNNNTLTLNDTTNKFGALYVGFQFLSSTSQVLTITAVVTAGTVFTLQGAYATNVASYTFYSVNSQFLNNLACSINFGKMLVMDQSGGQNSCIGFVYPSITPVTQNVSSYSYYASTLDNGNIQIAYPQNQTITVNFTNVDLVTTPTLFGNYT